MTGVQFRCVPIRDGLRNCCTGKRRVGRTIAIAGKCKKLESSSLVAHTSNARGSGCELQPSIWSSDDPNIGCRSLDRSCLGMWARLTNTLCRWLVCRSLVCGMGGSCRDAIGKHSAGFACLCERLHRSSTSSRTGRCWNDFSNGVEPQPALPSIRWIGKGS